MDTVLLVIHMILAVALVLVIMAQRAPQDGGGLTGGGSTMGGLFTARGSANLLTRVTSVLATLFICTSLLMGVIASHQHKARNIAQSIAAEAESETTSKDEAPAAAGAKASEAKPSEPVKVEENKSTKASDNKAIAPKAATQKKVDEKDSAGIKIEDKKTEKKSKSNPDTNKGPEVPVSR